MSILARQTTRSGGGDGKRTLVLHCTAGVPARMSSTRMFAISTEASAGFPARNRLRRKDAGRDAF